MSFGGAAYVLRPKRYAICWISVLLLLIAGGYADTLLAMPDTALARDSADVRQDSQPRAQFKPSAGKAMLLSAFLPGGGQFYCRRPVKGIIYGIVELAFAGATVHTECQRRNAYRQLRADTLILNNRRNNLLWLTGAVWAFTIADAYVSANMYGFDEEQRLSIRLKPLELGVAYRF